MPAGLLFHVKICGVTTPADAGLAAAAGADAIGVNFVVGSPRRIDPATARTVAAAVPPEVLVVGVFAGMPPAAIADVVHAVGLGAVQLHGHLAGPGADVPEACAALAALVGGLPLIRAVRFEAEGFAAARRWIAAAAALGATPALALVDAPAPRGAEPGALGGTGCRADWGALATEPPLGLPWALAGGLDAANVAEAIRITGARAVDVASGVESAPGRKDPARLAAFVAAARAAFAAGPVRTPSRG